MNNRAYAGIALTVMVAIAIDWVLFDNGGLIFTGRQIWHLADWLAFWR